jgi:hypothetical protein
VKIIDDIKKLISAANHESDIAKLINMNVRLSGYLFYLQEEETSAHKAYLDAYNERKYAEASFIIKSDLATNKAERQAIVETRELKQIETISEVIYNDLKGKRFASSEFIGVLTQKIANLRREFELKSKQEA